MLFECIHVTQKGSSPEGGQAGEQAPQGSGHSPRCQCSRNIWTVFSGIGLEF